MRAPHLFTLLLTLHYAATGGAATMATIENGWLTTRHAGVELLTEGEGRALELRVDGAVLPPDTATPVVSEVDGGFDVVYETETGRLTDQYRRFPGLGTDAWLRSLLYENLSQEGQDLTRAVLRLHPAGRENVWNPRDFWMGGRGADAVCIAYAGGADHYDLRASGDTVEHVVQACWRLAPGQQATVTVQGVWVGTAGTEAYRAEARRWFDAIDLHAPPLPEWLAEGILYQVCAGGHVDARFSDGGGFEPLRAQVPRLADLGVTAVWLMAVHKHKLPGDAMGAWNLYDPQDFTEIDPILGGPEALARLMKDFDAAGIRVLGELVPHGGHSVQAEAQPGGQTINQNGEPANNWGGASMDYASREWQETMRQAAGQLAEFGMVGARIDVADGSGPNWGSPRTNHASYSTRGGPLELLHAIRKGFTDHGQEGLLLPESWNTMEFWKETPLGYGHALWFLFWQDIPQMIEQPERMVTTLRDFFETQRGSYPPGTRIIRTLGNHDTTVHAGRVQYRFGAGLANALYGVCLMVPGVPMMYQEEENGLFETRRRLNLARRAVPEFAWGDADYFAADFGPRVFTVVRRTDTGTAIGLANLSGEAVMGQVRLSEGCPLPEGTALRDAATGVEATVSGHGTFPWNLPPYGVSLIQADAADASKGAVWPPKGTAGGVTVTADAAGLHIAAGELRATLGAGAADWRVSTEPDGTLSLIGAEDDMKTLRATPSADGWTVRMRLRADDPAPLPELFVEHAAAWKLSGRTALLEDRVLRRHFRFPAEVDYGWDRAMAWGHMPYNYYNGVCPSGRQWESMLEPLHPSRPALAFLDGDGQALLLEGVVASARNVVLTDRSDEAVTTPEGLALRFHDQDPDLRPRYNRRGWSFWQYEDESPPAPRDQALALTLRLADETACRRALEADRLPVVRNQPRLALDGSETRNEGDTVWFIEPGGATWSGLAAEPGAYRIAFEMRHSERSAEDTELTEHYTVEVNGQTIDFAWEQLNTYETGNAHFGRVLTDPVLLNAGDNSVCVRTGATWCALRPRFQLREAR